MSLFDLELSRPEIPCIKLGFRPWAGWVPPPARSRFSPGVISDLELSRPEIPCLKLGFHHEVIWVPLSARSNLSVSIDAVSCITVSHRPIVAWCFWNSLVWNLTSQNTVMLLLQNKLPFLSFFFSIRAGTFLFFFSLSSFNMFRLLCKVSWCIRCFFSHPQFYSECPTFSPWITPGTWITDDLVTLYLFAELTTDFWFKLLMVYLTLHFLDIWFLLNYQSPIPQKLICYYAVLQRNNQPNNT